MSFILNPEQNKKSDRWIDFYEKVKCKNGSTVILKVKKCPQFTSSKEDEKDESIPIWIHRNKKLFLDCIEYKIDEYDESDKEFVIWYSKLTGNSIINGLIRMKK